MQKTNRRAHEFFSKLPNFFTYQDAHTLAIELGIPQRTFSRWLSIGIEDRILESPSKAKYNKVEFVKPIVEPNSAEEIKTEPEGVEQDINMKDGTGKFSVLTSWAPRTPEEIIAVLKIDTTIWELERFWNKEKYDGRWLISALVTKKRTEVSIDNPEVLEEVLKRVFELSGLEPAPHPYPQLSNKKALFIYMSDKHVGAYVSSRALFVNDYNEQTFDERMKLLLNEILYIHAEIGRFEDIYLIDLGDKVDGLNGQTTRGGHKLPQNMSNREAFETTIKVEKDFFDRIIQADLANNIHVIQHTVSNHGGDFEYMVSRTMELYLNTRYPYVKTRILQQFIEHLEYGRHVLLLTHGKDDEDMKHGLPLNLNPKVENYLNKYLMYNKLDPQKQMISVIKGDLHQNNSQDAFGFRYRNVLSMFGGSKWMGHNFGPGMPGCSFDIIEKDTHRISESRIFFCKL